MGGDWLDDQVSSLYIVPERWALLCLMKLEGCVDTYKLGLFRYWDDSVSALLLFSCIVL